MSDLLERLEARIGGLDAVLVAFSGGVDSSLVAALAARALGARALAVTAVSPALAAGELEAARAVAPAIGIAHETIATDELASADYRRNDRLRCFHCKTELYERLAARSRAGRAVLSGANADDAGDWRPGLRAAAEHGVDPPAARGRRGQGGGARARRGARRSAARRSRPSPCLASRIPYGTPVAPETLAQIDRAEAAVRALGLRELRVRHYGEPARLEIGAAELDGLSGRRRAAALRAIRAAGYARAELDERPLRSGRSTRRARERPPRLRADRPRRRAAGGAHDRRASRHRTRGRRRARRAARRARRAGQRPAAARARPPRPARRDLDVRRHPRAAPRADDPGGARGARRHRRPTPTSCSSSRPAPTAATPRRSCARCWATTSSSASRSSTTTPAIPARSCSSACTATACRSRSTGAGWRPTCGSPPGSSSRTSSPASAAGRSSSPPGSPASTPCSCCTTPSRIGDPRATWAVTHGNPVHDDIRAAAAAAPPHFSLDVILNREQRIIAAFAGEMFAMHDAACAAARRYAISPVAAPFDVVVTSNSGFPLDQNLYQAVKGMSAAARIVKPGGTIVCAAECRDGFPGHGELPRAARLALDPGGAVERSRPPRARSPTSGRSRCRRRSRRAPRSSCTPITSPTRSCARRTSRRRATSRRPCATRSRRAGAGATVCVLPEGPQTIPILASEPL